jgi:hypothetical protein
MLIMVQNQKVATAINDEHEPLRPSGRSRQVAAIGRPGRVCYADALL